jgi:hypothetical protein
MEIALHVRDADEIRSGMSLRDAANWEISPQLRQVVALALERVREPRVRRFYFGTEFCENLLPTAAALEAFARTGEPLTMLTPYVSDRGIADLRKLFALLPAGSEVVFADWGVLHVLRREFPRLVPVQGRLLNKSLRDPRVTNLYAIEGTSNPTLDAMRASNLGNESYRNLLRRFGVERVEMDQLPQGTTREVDGSLKAHVYAPFGFIATSRSCMAAGLHYRGGEKFQPGAPCRHECQTHLLEYTYTNSPFANQDQKFWLKGNTYFYTHTAAMLDAAMLDAAMKGPWDRLVFQPRLPMVTA